VAESLYTTQTPDSLDNAEDTYTMGTEMVFAVDGQITGVRWRSATNAIATSPLAKVYSAAGAELASKAAGAQTPGGVWNSTLFDTPLAVTAGTYYVVAFGPINRYSALAAMHAAADVTNGNVTAPQNNVGGHKNGRFVASATVAFPSSSGGAGYFVDVLFEETGVTGALTGTLPALTGTAAGTVTMSGLLVASLPAFTGVFEAAVVAAVIETGSWYGLLSILREVRAIAAAEAARPPVACPNDGEPLSTGPGGVLHCKFDGYVWRGGS
jgi:hypothetical protein